MQQMQHRQVGCGASSKLVNALTGKVAWTSADMTSLAQLEFQLMPDAWYHLQWGPWVLIRTFALLEMAWYIAIHDQDNPVTQHGLASYVTKFEIRLRSKFGVIFAQQESCWRSQQSASASKSRGKGKAKLWHFFGADK